MRKFALLPLLCTLFGLQSAQAQVRDLFAEFEAENEKAAPAAPASSSAAVAPAAPAAPAAPSSSSVAVAVSSAVVSSSSVAPASSAIVSSSAVVSSSATAPSSSSDVLDSAVASSSSVAGDSSVVASDSAKVDSSVAQGQAYMNMMNAMVDSAKTRDSLAALSSSSLASSSSFSLSSSSLNRRDLLGPVKVSKVNGIDEMKGQYKSPRKALFLSLVIPGSGQLYIGSSKFTYLRGAVYLALEAGLWAGWYYNSVYKYDKQVDKYKKFANEHYSIGRYENNMYAIYSSLNDVNEEARFAERYMSSRQSFCEALYGKAGTRGCYSSSQTPYAEETSHKTYFGANEENLGKESSKGFYESSEVYQIIAGSNYVLGWDDADSIPLPAALGLSDPNSTIVALGKSSNRDKYRSLRNEANELADMQAWFIGGLILNHLVSAIDAALTANAHNKALYEEDLSWFDRLHFDSGISLFNGLGVDVRAYWGF